MQTYVYLVLSTCSQVYLNVVIFILETASLDNSLSEEGIYQPSRKVQYRGDMACDDYLLAENDSPEGFIRAMFRDLVIQYTTYCSYAPWPALLTPAPDR